MAGKVSGTDVVEAVVDAGGVVTRYRRAGRRGRGVVLLMEEAPADASAGALFQRLSGRFGVIAPQLVGAVWGPDGPAAARLESWLRDLLDGLGLDRPAIVLDEGLARALEPFLRQEGDRIGRVAVLRRGAPAPDPGEEPPPLSPPAPDASGAARVLVVDGVGSGLPSETATARLERFLEGRG